MPKKRNEYIDQLLGDLGLLEQRLLSVRESDTLPFSFFSASFDRIEKISRSLHELELMQIGEMKEQMERLVRFLSESEGRGNAAGEAEPSSKEEEATEYAGEPGYSGQPGHGSQPDNPGTPGYPLQGMGGIVMGQERDGFTERIVLPEYRDPRISEVTPPPCEGEGKALPGKNGEEKQAAPPPDDVVRASPALLDLRRGISLNDRFLFQRELFNNSRPEMDRVIEALNGMDSFAEAENYLKGERDWNFENQTVKDFLLVIKKGFE